MQYNDYFKLAQNPSNNYTFLPIYNHKYYEFYKKQLSTFWTVEEIRGFSKTQTDFGTCCRHTMQMRSES